MSDGVVIVGAGHGGVHLAGLLRQRGATGPISVLDEQVHEPYQRPPLSKAFLSSEVVQPLKPAGFFEAHDIDVVLGARVTDLRVDDRVLVTSSGDELPYEHLVLATGSNALTFSDLLGSASNVVFLRTVDDALTLAARSSHPGARFVIIGAGYIGLEVGALLRSLGRDVTILERDERVLSRSASPELSRIVEAHHRKHGCRVEVGSGVRSTRIEDGQITAVVMASGEVVPCDVVLVGAGATANDELAHAAGLTCDDGIVVDAQMRTSAPHVFAIGDAVRIVDVTGALAARGGSIPRAVEHAKAAAASILGLEPPPVQIPWFWSDQFDLKLKMAGRLPAGDYTTVTRSEPDQSHFGLYHLDRDSRVVAVETVNSPRDFAAGKALISSARVVDPEVLADPGTSLTDIVSSSSKEMSTACHQ